MKKITAFAAVIIACSAVFMSCGKKASVDQYGWYHDFDDAQKEAQHQKKNILLVISMAGDDDNSQAMKDSVFETEDFKKTVAKKMIPVNLDFSQKSYQAGTAPENATAKEQKAADEKTAQMKKNMTVASKYNVQSTPAMFILTKEGYYITRIDYSDNLKTVDAFNKEVDAKAGDVTSVTDMVKAIDKASGVEKVKAIDKLYENTNPDFQMLLVDLSKSVPSLDEKNETGLVGKYVMAAAYSDASTKFQGGDYTGASKIFSDAAENKALTGDERMQTYYMAAYLLGSSGSNDYATIASLLQKSYDSAEDKESENALQVKNTLTMIQQLASQQPADQKSAGTDSEQKKE